MPRPMTLSDKGLTVDARKKVAKASLRTLQAFTQYSQVEHTTSASIFRLELSVEAGAAGNEQEAALQVIEASGSRSS